MSNKQLWFSYQIEGAEGLSRAFDLIKQAPNDFTPVFKKWEKDYEEREAKLFKRNGALEGLEKWPALTPKYEKWKDKYAAKRGWPGTSKTILVLSGALRQSITEKGASGSIREMTTKSLTMGTSLKVKGGKYNLGMIHQMGWGRVPIRRSVVMSQKQKKDWVRMAHKWLHEKVLVEALKEKDRVRSISSFGKEGV